MKGSLLDRPGSYLILFDIIMFYDTRPCFLYADALASSGHSGYLAAAETLTPGMNHDWVDIDYRLPICCPCTNSQAYVKKAFLQFCSYLCVTVSKTAYNLRNTEGTF
jgi:hypothetical protein